MVISSNPHVLEASSTGVDKTMFHVILILFHKRGAFKKTLSLSKEKTQKSTLLTIPKPDSQAIPYPYSEGTITIEQKSQ